MSRWFTSDTHFGHTNIIKFCERPFNNVAHMNEVLIANWNSVVQPDDEVFHLGDVALGPWEQWDSILTRLNGHKTLVVGNHDRVFRGQSLLQRERFRPMYQKWFTGGVWPDYSLDLINGTEVNLSHFPYDGDSHGEDRFVTARLYDESVPLIHGHTHSTGVLSRSRGGTRQVHVGVDAWNYTPVSEETVALLVGNLDSDSRKR